MRPWDVSNDLLQYESEYKIQTWTRHKTPVVRTCSITNLEKQPDNINSSIRNTSLRRLNVVGEESESSCPEVDPPRDSDSSERVPGKSMYNLMLWFHIYTLNTNFCGFRLFNQTTKFFCTTKGIDNKKSHLQVSKPQMKMSANISDFANPWKLMPIKINKTTWNDS